MTVRINGTLIKHTRTPSPESQQSKSPLGGSGSSDNLELGPSKSKGPKAPLNPPTYKSKTYAEAVPLTRKQQEALTLKKQKAVAQLQAFGRGTLIRREMVFPYQLEGSLKNALRDLSHSSSQSEDLSKILAREILESAKAGYQDHGKRLSIASGTYQYAGKELKVPMDIWISRKGNKVEIELIASDPLGEGTLKEVYPSHTITLSLEAPQHERKSQKTVVARFLAKHKELISAGSALVSKNFSDQEIKDLHLAGILTKMDRISTEQVSFRKGEPGEAFVSGLHEARDTRYRGDLRQIANKNELTIEQKRKILSDVAKAVKAFHQKGIVHRDIKPQNIFIDAARNGCLADFDTVATPGIHKDLGGTEAFLDRFSMVNERSTIQLVTPLTDIYALAVTAEQLGIDSPKAQAVRAANKRPFSEPKERPFTEVKERRIRKGLNSPDARVKQEAVEELNEAFPEFQDFLNSLIQAPAK